MGFSSVKILQNLLVFLHLIHKQYILTNGKLYKRIFKNIVISIFSDKKLSFIMVHIPNVNSFPEKLLT